MVQRIFTLILALACVMPAAWGQDAQPGASGLSILYAGSIPSPRATAWEAFLRQSFRQVDLIPIQQLSEESAEGHDVVIADTPDARDWRLIKRDLPEIGRGFDRPMILIGGAAEIVSWSKIGPRRRDYGLTRAFNLRGDHPILRGPRDPRITTVP